MATISPRKDQDGNVIGWQAIVRKRGFPSQTKTFRGKRDAENWATVTESEMIRGTFIQRNEAERMLLADALARYEQEVTCTKRGAAQERSHIRALLASNLAKLAMASIGSKDVSQYRDTRLQTVSASTLNRELNILSHVFTVAIQDWGIGLPHGNPVTATRRPKVSDRRDRRLQNDEEDRLLAWAEKAENQDGSMPIAHIIRFALETGMRRGEIVAMRWEQVNIKARVLHIPETKTGEARRIPLSSVAVTILDALPRRLDGKVWDSIHEASLSRAFARACKRASIEGLRFHDLRHEATSRFFEKGLNPMQVAAITGHKTLQMLKRYTHLRAEDLAKLLG